MTRHLNDIDFMMMDLHRPPANDEVEADPSAYVDKTIGAGEDVVSEDESVDSAPAKRCEVCFGPMPCEAHANVAQWDGITSNSLDPATVLAGAHNADLESVVIVGMQKDGREYFASSDADAGISIYYLQRGIHKLNRIVDGEEVERVRQDPA